MLILNDWRASVVKLYQLTLCLTLPPVSNLTWVCVLYEVMCKHDRIG